MTSKVRISKNTLRISYKSWVIALILGMLLFACSPVSPTPTLQLSDTKAPVTATSTQTSVPTPTATPEPPQVLTICIAEDPQSLYLYDGRNTLAKQSVFAAIFPDPFVQDPDGGLSGSLLESIPAPDNGGVQLEAREVQPGDVIVDAYGNLTVFKRGVFVRPAGCTQSSCAVTWEEGSFSMDQMVVEFQLKPGLMWSDGSPMTAADSLFSYGVAEQTQLASSQWALDRTDSYAAESDQAVIWRGIPGFATASVSELFWNPLPAHQLGNLTSEELAIAEQAARLPLGWGPYRLTDWQPGVGLHLEKNPHYHLASEDQPAYDLLNYLVIPEAEKALEMFGAGECDLLDRSYHLEGLDSGTLQTLASEVNNHVENLDPVQQLVFGIRPASFDNGYNIWDGDRPDLLGDLRTRQAIAAALYVGKLQALAFSKFPGDLKLSDNIALPKAADAAALLEEVGWIDTDSDPATPRTARNIAGVLDQTPLTLNLLSGQSQLDQLAAEWIVEHLAEIGVAVNWQALPVENLYAPGPDGLLFGRQFDLALVSWQPSVEPACRLYSSSAIPNRENGWVGTNLAGYADSAFDLICADLTLSIAQEDAWEGLPEYLPAQPLLAQPTVWMSSKQLIIPEGADLSHLYSFTPAE